MDPADPSSASTDPPPAPSDFQTQLEALLQKFKDIVPSDRDFVPPFPPARNVDHVVGVLPSSPAK